MPANQIQLQVTDGLQVAVIQDQTHEFLMPTSDVAAGYGVKESTIASNKHNHKDELKENVHFLVVQNMDSGSGNFKKLLWTKAGVIRLGMFIKSERAKMFRDWVEKVVLQQLVAPQVSSLPTVPKRKHNRLNAERIIDIMADIALIQDKELRMRIISKLLPDREDVQLTLPLKTK